jgi:hypothetical protein
LLLKKENSSNNGANESINENSKKTEDEKTPNFDRIYTFLGSLYDPSKYNHQELMNSMSMSDKECLKVKLKIKIRF